MILAQLFFAKLIDLIMASLVNPTLSPALSAIIFAYGFAHAIPIELSTVAAIIPATCVPCVLVVGNGYLSLSMKSYQC
jgi:hypothetical protein